MTPCSSVSIVNFEHVNARWDEIFLILLGKFCFTLKVFLFFPRPSRIHLYIDASFMWIGVEMLYMTICTALGIKGEMMYAPPPLNEMFYNSRMLSGILMKLW